MEEGLQVDLPGVVSWVGVMSLGGVGGGGVTGGLSQSLVEAALFIRGRTSYCSIRPSFSPLEKRISH